MKTLPTQITKQSLPTANGKLSILLVDDDPRNLDVLESILASLDFRLLRAQHPEDALLRLVQEDIACIVLDIRMPSMSGIELARLIKTRKRSQHIPIIFLTAYAQGENDVLKGYGAGAVDYLTKPFAPEILRSKVGVFADLFRKTRALTEINAALELEVHQRKNAENALRQANDQLALLVQERTADLSRTVTELQLTEIRYREVVHGLSVAVYVCDVQGRITLFNQAAVELWGREPVPDRDLWCGSYRIFRVDGTVMPLDECPMALTVRNGEAVRGEEIVVERPDGTRRNILPYPEPIRDATGKIIGAVNMLVDITDRKRGEEASRRLAAIVESSEDAIISKDLNGVIKTWNKGAERHFGFTAEEALGQPGSFLMPPERYDEEPQILDKIRNGIVVENYETVRRRKDGSLMEVSLTVSPIKNHAGKIIGASKIIRDITEQKKAKQELERAHKDAVAASRAKDDFLATLSHELRTPLNPVLLVASDASDNPELPPAVRADFEMIRRNVELEARLIDDLLDLTRISHGKLALNKQFLCVHDILRDAIDTVQGEIHQKRITLRLNLAADQSTVFADDIRLRQVFWNVLKNAVKFTPHDGKITVETRPLADQSRLAVIIIDTGIGMKSEEIGKVFDAFSQADHAEDSGTRRYGGLGLGLTISRMLVELHSGSISAFSAGRGQGAVFTIELPIAKRSKESPPLETSEVPVCGSPGFSSASTSRRDIRILLVEDHEPTRTALARLLVRRRYQVVAAGSLAEAHALARNETFNLLISDIGLPDGNGCDLMASLQKQQGLKGIALTGYGMEKDIARSQSAGFAAHLTKPVRAESLDSALVAVLSEKEAG